MSIYAGSKDPRNGFIDEMQFGFVPGKGTTDAIFIARRLQEKFITARKPLYFAFIDLEKAFDRVPQKVLWWSLRSVGVEELAIRIIQGMYANACSRVRELLYADDLAIAADALNDCISKVWKD